MYFINGCVENVAVKCLQLLQGQIKFKLPFLTLHCTIPTFKHPEKKCHSKTPWKKR